ncbi:MAG: hypothetical protein GY694_09085, partial [Gammaproteobacteria bacterium]|nr:hypothetical protein [Gammaproteobacteria bacterium]
MAAINKIISWNCQLLETSTSAGKKAELLQMINEINPVIILLQETGLKPKSNICERDKLHIPGYQEPKRIDVPFDNNYAGNRGILIAFKEGVRFKKMDSQIKNFGIWQSYKVFKGDSTKTAFHITNIYLRPEVEVDYDELEQLLCKYADHTISGDFNAKDITFSMHNERKHKDASIIRGEKLVDMFDRNGTHILNTGEITRLAQIPNQKHSAIDLSLVSQGSLELTCRWSRYNDTLGSDHFPQIITIDENVSSSKGPITQLTFQ